MIMKYNYKLSILIPVRNGMPYLRMTLESLFQELQKIDSYEVIISDNFSTDGTSAYLDSLTFNNLKIVKPSRDFTISENWNFLSQHASGEYIKLLCADDCVYPESVTHQIEILEKHPDVSGAIGTRILVDSNGRILKKNIRLFRKIGTLEMSNLMSKFWISGTNYFGEPGALLFRSEIYKRGMPFSDSLPYVIDLNFYFKCFQDKKVHLSNNPALFFRVHDNSLSSELRKSQAKQFLRLYQSTAPKYIRNRTILIVVGFYVLIRSKINQNLRIFLLNRIRKMRSSE